MTTDWLNPILVKEIRQGLKSRGFMASFMGMQGLMVLSMVFYLASLPTDRSPGDLESANVWFWGVIVLILLGAMPARACLAVSGEHKNKTLELLHISHLSPRAIVYGKWTAHTAQLLLIVSAVPPYMIFRYYFGSVNITTDLVLFGFFLSVSLMLLASSVGMSAQSARFSRYLVLWPAAAFLGFLVFVILEEFGSITTGDFLEPDDLLVLGLTLVVFTFFCLEAGAGFVSPPTLRSSVPKRFLAVLVFLLWYGFALYHKESVMVLFGILFLLPMGADALCEPVHTFARRPKTLAHRLPLAFRAFLLPGWKSGLLFYTSLFLVAGALTWNVEKDRELLWFLHSFFNTLIAPLSLVLLIPHRPENRVALYMTLQCVSLALCIPLLMLNITNWFLGPLLAFFFPMFGTVWLFDSSHLVLNQNTFRYVFLFAVTAFYLLVPLVRAFTRFSDGRFGFKEAVA